jgi:hypothetical protein
MLLQNNNGMYTVMKKKKRKKRGSMFGVIIECKIMERFPVLFSLSQFVFVDKQLHRLYYGLSTSKHTVINYYFLQ